MSKTPYELTFFGTPTHPNTGKPIRYARFHRTEVDACNTAHRVLGILSMYANGNRAAHPAIIYRGQEQVRSIR